MATWAARQTPAESKAKYAARDVCLDQDAAGRLLENMGDHVRREMIVRITRVVRQNPAYRPFAQGLQQPPTEHSRRLFYFPTRMLLKSDYAS